MTYDAMPAGREMDALVAEKVMGQVPCGAWSPFTAYPPTWVKNEPGCDHANCYPQQMGPPPYSTDITAAWGVVEKMGRRFDGLYPSYHDTKDGWRDGPLAYWVAVSCREDGEWRQGSLADTVPLAICRAALKAEAA